MIELVACDIDGTLLRAGEQEVRPLVFEQITRLQKKGVLFCPASGRQYGSLRRLFAPIADKIYYICNNGAIIFGPDKGGILSERILSKTVLPRLQAENLCNCILSRDSFELVVAGVNTDYICPKKINLTEHLEGIGYNVVKVDGPEKVPEDILKVTAYCEKGSDRYYRELQDLWGSNYQVAVSGERWIDITLSDKGMGLSSICRTLNIPLKNVMAIGDNYNDLQMLDIVGCPVVMENAAEDIKLKFITHCSKVEEVLADI